MRLTPIFLGTLAVALAVPGARAQDSSEDDRPERAPRARVLMRQLMDDDAANRAVLGVNTTSTSSDRDTLGVLIAGITPGGPAEKAGLEEGNRIAAINGVNLQLAPADAGERDMRGMATRRLMRELSKVKPGGDVELRVWANGAFKTMKVKTVAADSLPGRMRRVSLEERRAEREKRAVLGLGLSASGSRRDTLGVLVVRVAPDGPAEKAGIVEGDRIAAVNGVDLRVAREDALDQSVSGAKVSRFQRELRKLKPGDSMELRVVSGGQLKTVRVTAAAAKDVYDEERGNSFFFGDIGEAPMPPLPPMAPLPPMPPVAPFDGDFEFEFDGGPMVRAMDLSRVDDVAARAAERAAERARRVVRRMRVTGEM